MSEKERCFYSIMGFILGLAICLLITLFTSCSSSKKTVEQIKSDSLKIEYNTFERSIEKNNSNFQNYKIIVDSFVIVVDEKGQTKKENHYRFEREKEKQENITLKNDTTVNRTHKETVKVLKEHKQEKKQENRSMIKISILTLILVLGSVLLLKRKG